MESIALVLFVLGALGGLFLAVRHFTGRSLPLPVSVLHGLLGAAALVLLLLAWLRGGGGLAPALVVLVIAALGGFFVFSFHLRGRRAPSPAVVIHAAVAVAGVITLLLALL